MRVVADALDQRRTAARDEAVDVLGELHDLDRGLVRRVVDQDQRVLGQAGLGEPLAERRRDGEVGAQRGAAPPQQRGVPGLEAEPGGVGGDVRPVLVDDRHDAERHPHPLDLEPVRAPPAVEHLADRVGQRGHLAQAGGHGPDPGVGQPEPVERARLHAAGGRGLQVGLVGGQHLGGPLLQHLGGGQQGGVLGRGRRRGEDPGRSRRPATQVGHRGSRHASQL